MIYLHSGHSGGEVGAVANGTTEENECRAICTKVIDTIRTGVTLLPGTLGLAKTIPFINAHCKETDIVLAIHMDSGSKTSEGAMMYYFGGDENSKTSAMKMLEAYTKTTGIKNRGVLPDTASRFGKLGIIRDTQPISFLLELGFITNSTELQKMRTLAVKGIIEVLNILSGKTMSDTTVQPQKVATWAEASFVKAEKRGFSRKDPEAPVDPVRLRHVLLKAGFDIKDTEEPVTYQELVHTLDKKGIL